MHESRKFLMFREVDYPYKYEKYVTNENQKLQMRTDFYRQMLNFDHKKCQCSSLQSNQDIKKEKEQEKENKETIYTYPNTQVEDMIERNVEMHEIIKSINNHRIIIIKGKLGIGKKFITNKVALLLQDR